MRTCFHFIGGSCSGIVDSHVMIGWTLRRAVTHLMMLLKYSRQMRQIHRRSSTRSPPRFRYKKNKINNNLEILITDLSIESVRRALAFPGANN